ncbi:hypothetical protein [Acinetobacter nosocomialis]|uniref:Uncharacterized protein n=2 Tax=Moraxellaceae TaxID=468 RepID=A0AAV3ILR5_ACINO|nr:hypothetical protein [Acinetobacter nosocomialis]PCM90538.1 hypothetical protein CP902_16560 [Acinetobacter baumannii]ENV40613.1 hypothetical protein F958_03647 [Acinetobacter nosocomialis NIPH 386]PZM01508.1 hypothetical protein DOL92_10665 [Acinetobacter nosocomialis]RDY37967.1 hypothetical protein DX997_16390 [Acinetobacter baumannii]HCD4659900.1 hypothetical protein [Acinetobacter nosocomialis]
MLIQINSKMVIKTEEVKRLKKEIVEGPCDREAWFVMTVDNEWYLLTEYSLEEFLLLVNKEA